MFKTQQTKGHLLVGPELKLLKHFILTDGQSILITIHGHVTLSKRISLTSHVALVHKSSNIRQLPTYTYSEHYISYP